MHIIFEKTVSKCDMKYFPEIGFLENGFESSKNIKHIISLKKSSIIEKPTSTKLAQNENPE